MGKRGGLFGDTILVNIFKFGIFYRFLSLERCLVCVNVCVISFRCFFFVVLGGVF